MMETIKKYWWVGLVLVLVACLAWLFPTYRKVVRSNDELHKAISDQQKIIESRVKEKIVRVPILLGEKIVYKTIRVRDTDNSEVTTNHTDTVNAVSTKESITEKRGQVVIGVGVTSNAGLGLMAQATFFGPLGIAGSAEINTTSLGLAGGAIYVTLAF